MKIAMMIMLAGLGYVYLVLCFYVVPEGLADVGNTTVLAWPLPAWPSAPACAPNSPDIMRTLEAGSARDPPNPAGL